MTPRIAAAALAMVVARVERECHLMAFSDEFIELPVTSKMRLDDVVRLMSDMPFGRTDCALPMVYARERRLNVDTFQVFTDNETWCGGVHPHQALREYRKQSGIPARMAVVACTPTRFSIADPKDPGQLDVCGFDTTTPSVLSAFSRGEF